METILEWLITHRNIRIYCGRVRLTFFFNPQVIKLGNPISVISISLIMYVIISIDSVLWLIYGSILALTPLIVQSSITFTCAFMMIIMKLLWNNRKIRTN